MYCVMSEPGDGLSYIDVDAWTYTGSGERAGTTVFTRINLIADDCTMSVAANDWRFASHPDPTFTKSDLFNGKFKVYWLVQSIFV